MLFWIWNCIKPPIEFATVYRWFSLRTLYMLLLVKLSKYKYHITLHINLISSNWMTYSWCLVPFDRFEILQLHMWIRGWELVAISSECLQNFICILGTWQINLDQVKCFLSSSSLKGSSHSPTISYCFCFAISHFLISLISRKKKEEEKSFMKRLLPACNKSLMSQKGQRWTVRRIPEGLGPMSHGLRYGYHGKGTILSFFIQQIA